MYKIRQIPKNMLLAAAIGAVGGILWLAGVRFLTMRDSSVHYHANFALYVDGQRDQFDNFTFYEEVQSCSGDDAANPKVRVHLHDNVNSVVHVHDNGATWGHFFANLGYALGNTLLKTDEGVYIDGQNGKQLTFILNGQEIGAIANRTIASEDSLLVNYGTDSAQELTTRFSEIPNDAAGQNSKPDPGGCGGSRELTFMERLKRSFIAK